jgi:hypothetical protein
VPSDPREMIRSLLDVPGLEDLGEVCKIHGVSLTCHGSTARRIAVAASQNESLKWDIFDCVRFSSDIDLVHSGSSKQTADILRDIYRTVPFAEQLRWELVSREEQAPFENAKLYSSIIPALWIALGTREGWIDPWDGLSDVSAQKFRFMRNGFYSRSPLFQAGNDIELLGVLLYYNILVEMPDFTPEREGLAAAREIVEEATEQATTIRLQESAYLRSKLRYALASLKTEAPERLKPSAPLFRDWGLDSLEPLLESIGGAGELLAILNWEPQYGHLAISSRIGGDLYRLPAVSAEPWEGGGTALESFIKATRGLSRKKTTQLDSGQKLMLGSQSIECSPGVAPSAQESEFVHMCVRVETPIKMPPKDLSSICVVSGFDHPSVALSVPTTCSIPTQNNEGYLAIRCNLGRALSSDADAPGRKIQLFVVQLMEHEVGARLERISPPPVVPRVPR